jgi:DNA-binding CsgD family transcriptional regulator
VLSDDQRQTLACWAKRPTSSQALALRCRIVLACAEGLSNVEIGRRLDVHEKTVGKWRARFLQRCVRSSAPVPR